MALIAALLLSLAGPLRAAPEEEPTAAARAFLAELRAAGWTGAAETQDVSISARAAALGSQGLLDALAAGDALGEADRAALADVARVEVRREGWLMGRRVTPGRYSVGMLREGRTNRFALYADGDRISLHDTFWITGTTKSQARVAASTTGGATLFHVHVGDIDFEWRFVSVEAHDAAAATDRKATVGRVTLWSDFVAGAALEELAQECDAAVDVHAGLLGVDPPPGPYHLHISAEEAPYTAVDQLLTGGRFARNGAFASDRTLRAYFWYAPHDGPAALADGGFTRRARALALHELHHLVAYHARRQHAGPDWLVEGLADLGTWRALGADETEDGRIFAGRIRSLWHFALRRGVRALPGDFFADAKGDDLVPWYAAAFFLARRCEAERPGELARLLGKHAWAPPKPRRAELLQEFEAAFGPASRVFASAVAEASTDAGDVPVVQQGHVDRDGDAWRCTAAPDSNCRALLARPIPGPDVDVRCEFAWHPAAKAQADFFIAFWPGRERIEFLKVAVMPKRITLLRFADGNWDNWGSVGYDRGLAVSEAGKPAWHPLRIRLTQATRKVRVDVAKGRWAELDLSEHVSTHDTFAGFGCYDGICWVRGFRAE